MCVCLFIFLGEQSIHLKIVKILGLRVFLYYSTFQKKKQKFMVNENLHLKFEWLQRDNIWPVFYYFNFL